jgi:hypothetical protein
VSPSVLRTVSCRSVARCFRGHSVWKGNSVLIGYVVIVRASRPMINHGASVASYRTVVCIAARDSVIAIVETHLALRSTALTLQWSACAGGARGGSSPRRHLQILACERFCRADYPSARLTPTGPYE